MAICGAAAVGFFLVLFGSFFLLFRYDAPVAHFTGRYDKYLMMAAYIGAAILTACMARGVRVSEEPTFPKNKSVRITACIAALFLLVFGVSVLFYRGTGLALFFSFLVFIAAVATAGVMLYTTFLPTAPVTLGYIRDAATALTLLFYAMLLYFDVSEAMNTPYKLYTQLSFILLALYFLAECRMQAAEKRPRLRFFISVFSVSSALSVAIPSLLCPLLHGSFTAHNPITALTLLAFAAYCTARLIAFCASDIPEESEPNS